MSLPLQVPDGSQRRASGYLYCDAATAIIITVKPWPFKLPRGQQGLHARATGTSQVFRAAVQASQRSLLALLSTAGPPCPKEIGMEVYVRNSLRLAAASPFIGTTIVQVGLPCCLTDDSILEPPLLRRRPKTNLLELPFEKEHYLSPTGANYGPVTVTEKRCWCRFYQATSSRVGWTSTFLL